MKLLLLLSVYWLAAADGYKILCVFSIPSKSHDHLGKGIVNALLKEGHEVTWVTPYPPKEPLPKGLSIIDGSETLKITEKTDMTDKRHANTGMSSVRAFSLDISTVTANISALREVLVTQQFDAVVTETFFSDVDTGYAAVQQAPWIVLSSVVLQPMVESMVDDVKSLSTVPMLMNDFPIPMNFWQRVVNVAKHGYMLLEEWGDYEKRSVLYNTLFSPLAAARGTSLPSFTDASQNVSILLVNSHFSFAPAQSLPPNVVEIGGYHIEETTPPLPQDLQDILDSSTNGVIYFSMGSVFKSSNMPTQTKKDILETLGELPYTVLWKFEEKIDGLPSNVHIRAWMPQAAILAHKNTKVFITHGGLLSILESLRYGVPLVAVPVFADQPANAARAVRSGYAVKVDYNLETLGEGLKTGLNEILNTDTYTKQSKFISSLFNKRLVPVSKLISHYVEVAIESKGAYHLRSKSKLYSWYQIWLLDQIAALIAVLFIIYKTVRKIISVIAGMFSGGKSKSTGSVSKKVKRN